MVEKITKPKSIYKWQVSIWMMVWNKSLPLKNGHLFVHHPEVLRGWRFFPAGGHVNRNKRVLHQEVEWKRLWKIASGVSIHQVAPVMGFLREGISRSSSPILLLGTLSFPNKPEGSQLSPSLTWRMGSHDLQVVNNHGDRCCPLTGVVGPLPNGHSWLWLIHGGDPNYFVSGMILQVPFLKPNQTAPKIGRSQKENRLPTHRFC